jgi:hypothetical protein
MAVYNGFSTRKKEALYNQLTFELISELKDQVFLQYLGQSSDVSKWSKTCTTTLRRMHKLEKEKFLPPRYSNACEELVNYLGIQVSPKKLTSDKDLPSIHLLQNRVNSSSASKILKKKYIK